jgi:hypothetical protein
MSYVIGSFFVKTPGCRASVCIPKKVPIFSPRPHQRYIPRPVVGRSNLDQVFELAALDTAPDWTLDQIAGLVFGGFLVALYFSSKFIDEYIAVSQRRQLGICEKCGGLNDKSTCSEKECPLRNNQG